MQSMDPGHLFTAHTAPQHPFSATEFCTHYAPQEHDEDAEQNPFKLYGNVKPVEGRVVYVVFTPGNAITPSRNSSLVSQTQFVFGRKFNSDLGGSGAEH